MYMRMCACIRTSSEHVKRSLDLSPTRFFSGKESSDDDDGVTQSHGQVSVCADHTANAAGPSYSS